MQHTETSPSERNLNAARRSCDWTPRSCRCPQRPADIRASSAAERSSNTKSVYIVGRSRILQHQETPQRWRNICFLFCWVVRHYIRKYSLSSLIYDKNYKKKHQKKNYHEIFYIFVNDYMNNIQTESRFHVQLRKCKIKSFSS